MIIPFKKHHPKIHAESFVAPSANIIGRVTIGKGASIWYGAVLRGDINKIEVGAGTNIQDQCVLHVEKDRPCIVKNGVTVGHQATIHACTIEEGALIGIGVRILNGAVVGRYSLVGAGSVVFEDTTIPPYSLAVGTPARVVRRLTPKEITHLKQAAKNYEKLSKDYRRQKGARSFLCSPELTPLTDLSAIF